MSEKPLRICPGCGKVLNGEDYRACPYCGRSLISPQLPIEKPAKKRHIARTIAGVVLGIILLFAVFSILSYMRTPQIRIECVDSDASFTDDRMHMILTVSLKNSGSSNLNVEVEFKTTWNGNSDTDTQEFTLAPQQTKTVSSAILNANPDPESMTYYDIKWIANEIS